MMDLSNLSSYWANIYDEMETRNKYLILKNGLQYDHLLNEQDDRRCLAIWSFGTFHESVNFQKLLQDCKDAFPKHFIYEAQDKTSIKTSTPRLHHTFLQCIGFDNSTPFEPFLEKLKSDSFTINPYQISFYRLIALQTGLTICGIPKRNDNIFWLNGERHAFRNKYDELIQEPYFNDIVQSRLVRFGKSTNDSKNDIYNLERIVSEWSYRDLGTLDCQEFFAGPASWKMTLQELSDHKILPLTQNVLV